MNLMMHELNQVKLLVCPQEFDSPCLSPRMPHNRSLHRDFSSLERFTKNLEKGLEWASLNNPVRGRMTLLKL
jgi:hypothetical protein